MTASPGSGSSPTSLLYHSLSSSPSLTPDTTQTVRQHFLFQTPTFIIFSFSLLLLVLVTFKTPLPVGRGPFQTLLLVSCGSHLWSALSRFFLATFSSCLLLRSDLCLSLSSTRFLTSRASLLVLWTVERVERERGEGERGGSISSQVLTH